MAGKISNLSWVAVILIMTGAQTSLLKGMTLYGYTTELLVGASVKPSLVLAGYPRLDGFVRV